MKVEKMFMKGFMYVVRWFGHWVRIEKKLNNRLCLNVKWMLGMGEESHLWVWYGSTVLTLLKEGEIEDWEWVMESAGVVFGQ